MVRKLAIVVGSSEPGCCQGSRRRCSRWRQEQQLHEEEQAACGAEDPSARRARLWPGRPGRPAGMAASSLWVAAEAHGAQDLSARRAQLWWSGSRRLRPDALLLSLAPVLVLALVVWVPTSPDEDAVTSVPLSSSSAAWWLSVLAGPAGRQFVGVSHPSFVHQT